MVGKIGLGLLITLASALSLNWGYLREHEAAREMPPLSIGRPLHTARLLLASRRWLVGFCAEAGGWLLFVLALALAPLALVQAVSAGGIGILAALVSRLNPSGLAPRERTGVLLSIAGLGALGASLAGGAREGTQASWAALALWLAGATAAAVTSLGAGRKLLSGGAAFGFSAGCLFAAGDISTKATVAGDIVLIPALLAFYAGGTLLLQMGFQRGGALVTAGLATLLTNAIPIAAGVTIFDESLPGGFFGVLRAIAFGSVVISAVFLAWHERGESASRAQSAAPAQLRSQ